MKALIYENYGMPEVLSLQEIPRPEPKPQEVLIKVMAASINKADWHLLRGEPFPIRFMTGLFKPKYPTPGADVSGVVEQVGDEVTHFKPGDEVYGDLSGDGFGAFATYAIANEARLAKKPSNLTYEETAALPMAAVTALQGLRDKGEIQKGQKVLINGASGGVGGFAIQIAKAFEAEVTAVCSTPKVEQAKAQGADFVIDYKQEDFTKNDKQYDLIFDVVGNHSIRAIDKVLSKGGRYVSSAFSMGAMFLGPWKAATGGKKLINLLASPNQADLQFISKLVAEGKLKPVIHKTFPLDAAPEGIQLIGKGSPNGKLVVNIQ